MAKKIRRILALVAVLTLCVAQFVMPANAWGNNYEYVQIVVNGQVQVTHKGAVGNDEWLIRGTYSTPVVTVSGTTVTYTIGKQVGKTATIALPDGYTVGNYEATVTVNGVNSSSAHYDNAVINIKISSVKKDGEEIIVNPDIPIDVQLQQTSVTVNHNYYTKDLYTDQTVLDGSTTGTQAAKERDIFTATPASSYNGNLYTQTTDASALTITVVADASKNVINIDYLRTIDTTPADTSVTVNHNYYTKDLYTDQTVLDGSTTGTQAAKERDIFTATPASSYNGNLYTQTTDASALTITVVADASKNVINIDYLRTIDTTPADTSVTVNHNYYTKDLYTGQTVLDGSGSENYGATEKDTFTATAVTSFNGNAYTRTTDDGLLTITVKADASKNVINIDYLRTIDTTPVDYAPTISIVKTAAAAEYEVGETITWIITVTNTSAYTAYDVTVTDELVNGSWSIDILEAGGSRTLTTTSVAAEEGTVKNVVVASWTDNDDIPDNEEPEEPKTTSDEETVTVSTPVPEGGTPVALDDEYPIEEPTDPAPPASTNPPVYYDYSDGSVEIPDEDVPLADVPKTGDLSFLWAAISLLSAGSAIALTKKRREN